MASIFLTISSPYDPTDINVNKSMTWFDMYLVFGIPIPFLNNNALRRLQCDYTVGLFDTAVWVQPYLYRSLFYYYVEYGEPGFSDIKIPDVDLTCVRRQFI